MARDRKKAKQRRARQERQSRRSSTRPDAQLAVDEQRRDEEATGGPGSVAEASGDAALAREAEAGLPVDEVDAPGHSGEPEPETGEDVTYDGPGKADIYEDELTDDEGGGVLAELVDRDADLGVPEAEDAELERQAVEAAPRRRRRGGETAAAEEAVGRPTKAAPRERREGNRVIAFLRACWAELQRVQWPDRRQVGQATAVVLGFVLIAGSYLGLLDAVWNRVINAIL